jgi:predicted transcriptional regulator of viral defense system
MIKTQMDIIVDLVQQKGFIRARDLKNLKIGTIILSRLVQKGILKRVGRGIYTLAEGNQPAVFQSYAQISKRIQNGIICLLSALTFHEITTQSPFEVWLAIPEKAWLPKDVGVPIRFVRFSNRALKEGIEEHIIENIPVKITNPARTIADCFKYRNKIGLDVAMEALKDGLHKRKCTRDEIWKYAKICRVTNVIRPYMEAMS